MKVETEGIILKTQKYKEYDEIIVAFTKNYGKVRMFAKSSKKIKSPLLSGTQLFGYTKLVINLRDNGSNLYEANIIKSFYDFSTNLSKYYLASYIVELLDKLQVENQTDSRLFNRTLNLFYAIVEYEDIKLMRIIFELFLIESIGIRPITDKCGICNSKDIKEYRFFDIEQGFPICYNCEGSVFDKERIDKNLVNFIDFIYKNSLNIARIMKAKISPKILEKTDEFLRKYINFHVGYVKIESYDILKEEEKNYGNSRKN